MTPAARHRIVVHLLRAGKVVRSRAVSAEVAAVGSAEGCQVRATGDPSLAPRHASLFVDEDGQLAIVPDGDAEVLVNGQPIDLAVLGPDDVVAVGKLRFRAELEGGRRTPAQPVRSVVPASPRATPGVSAPRSVRPPPERQARPEPSPTRWTERPPASPATEPTRKITTPTRAAAPTPTIAEPAAAWSLAQAAQEVTDPRSADADVPLLLPDAEDTVPPALPEAPTDELTLPPLARPPTLLPPQPPPTVPPSPRPPASSLHPTTPEPDDAETADLADVTSFVLRTDDGPAAGDRSRAPLLEVHQTWGNALLATRLFPRDTRAVQLGLRSGHRWTFLGIDMGFVPAPLGWVLPWMAPLWSDVEDGWRSDFVVARDALPGGRDWTLFESDGHGGYVAHVAAGWEGSADVDGGHRSFEALALDGLATGSAEEGWRIPLTGGLRLRIVSAGTVFFARLAPPAPRAFTRANEEPDWLFLTLLGFGGCAFLAVLALLALAPPPARPEVAEVPDRLVELLLEKPSPTPPRVEPKGEADPTEEGSKVKKDPRPGPKEARADKPRNVDAVLAALDRTRTAVSARPNLAGLEPGAGPTRSALNVIGAIASLGGEGLAVARTGGPLSTLSVEDVAGAGQTKVGEVNRTGAVRGQVTKMSSAATVQGSLSREEVARVINAHIGEIQGCYEKALMSDPGLGGRIVYDWTVTASGTVSTVRVRSSTLGNAAVATCITSLIQKWRFAEPEGGDVVVTYPFLFRSVAQ